MKKRVEKVTVSEHIMDNKHEKLMEKLVENMVALQKVQTNLAEKLDDLSKQISGLLSLFEMAAKSFAQHPGNQVTEKDTEFLDKIDKLLDQNKTIAKGLTLMEEKMREKMYGFSNTNAKPAPATPVEEAKEEVQEETQLSPSRPLPKF